MARFRAAFSACLLGLGALGCSRSGDSQVLARVGSSAVTRGEFERKLGEVAPSYSHYVRTPQGRRQFLDILIREKMILAAARADGWHRSAEFRSRMAEMRKEEDEKLSSAADYLLARLWMEDLAKRGVVAVGDEEVRRYHGEHPGEVLARHILLASPGEAESALRALRSGARFASLAKTRSLDSETAPEGGLLRPALYGEILPEFDVLFRMRNGELAGPLRSKLGYHVVLKEGERRVSLESAAPRIRNILEKQKLDRRLQSLEASLRVEVIDAAFK